MSKEMENLRKALDRKGINWVDRTVTYDENFFVERTMFVSGGYEWTVIYGTNTRGYESGLLELINNTLWKSKGYLSVKEVLYECFHIN